MTRRAPIEPRLELVELSWRMQSLQKSTRILDCGIYRTDTGFEVCTGYGPEDLLHSKLFTEIEDARDCAEEFRQTVIATGGFQELPLPGPVA